MNKQQTQLRIKQLIEEFNQFSKSSPLPMFQVQFPQKGDESAEGDWKSTLSLADLSLWNMFRTWEKQKNGTYEHILPLVFEDTPLTRKEKKEQDDWDTFRHPDSIPSNSFHQLEDQETEDLTVLVDESVLIGMKNNGPQLGWTNNNGMLQDPDPKVRGGWETISKTQPNGEEEQLDSYGLRKFWNTKSPRRSNGTTQEAKTHYTIEEILGV